MGSQVDGALDRLDKMADRPAARDVRTVDQLAVATVRQRLAEQDTELERLRRHPDAWSQEAFDQQKQRAEAAEADRDAWERAAKAYASDVEWLREELDAALAWDERTRRAWDEEVNRRIAAEAEVRRLRKERDAAWTTQGRYLREALAAEAEVRRLNALKDEVAELSAKLERGLLNASAEIVRLTEGLRELMDAWPEDSDTWQWAQRKARALRDGQPGEAES